MTANVSVVGISYNSASTLRGFLESIPEGVTRIVVDNASSDGSAEIAERAGASVVRLPKNLGYGAACNTGGEAAETRFLIFANPDIRFRPGALEALVAAAERNPNAAFNPRMYSRGKQLFRRRSRLLPQFGRFGGALPDGDCSIPVLSGACILVRREHWQKIGGFDPAIFLFHEDDDFSLRLQQIGVELRLAAAAVIEHAQGTSTERSARIGRLKGEAMGRSLVYVMRKHGVPLDVEKERMRARAKLLLPHVLFNAARREKHLGFLRGLDEATS
ncbi:glycosyl transferase [Terrihabitans soli]|uniref:Glycosyl transferase n=1 Tax=Terrihabitans soli TaxID=708113 RepID=A0A6S6QRR0_9HYPH|nr:glycosyltransferase family 2 protein [Terrihabitans soli]BCJ92306.1 glycosyl transferase [Terrihabitans soli]